MKRLFYLSTIVLMISGCSVSPEKKVANLIKESMLKTLIFPESYDPIETKLDSAFSPQFDPDFIQLILDLNNKGFEYESLQSQIASAEREMSIWDTPYSSSFSKTQLKQAKEKLESLNIEFAQLESRLQKMGAKVYEQLNETEKFIGYKAHHSYRARNNAGNTMIGDEFFLIDKDLTTVIKTWSSEEITLYEQILKTLTEKEDSYL